MRAAQKSNGDDRVSPTVEVVVRMSRGSLLISRPEEGKRQRYRGCSRDIHVLPNVIGWNLNQLLCLCIDKY